ncbi:uncharacterized protein LOC110355490 isoform X2 [Columba livia]|uniref:uncharacterized protein LOC110355490 isoform X2 n=1 Tax=Columba livia TaxID=8932 RepID=UPI0031BB7750
MGKSVCSTGGIIGLLGTPAIRRDRGHPPSGGTGDTHLSHRDTRLLEGPGTRAFRTGDTRLPEGPGLSLQTRLSTEQKSFQLISVALETRGDPVWEVLGAPGLGLGPPRSLDPWELGLVPASRECPVALELCHREGSSQVSFTLRSHVWLLVSLSHSLQTAPWTAKCFNARDAGTRRHLSLHHHQRSRQSRLATLNKLIQFGEPKKEREIKKLKEEITWDAASNCGGWQMRSQFPEQPPSARLEAPGFGGAASFTVRSLSITSGVSRARETWNTNVRPGVHPAVTASFCTDGPDGQREAILFQQDRERLGRRELGWAPSHLLPAWK